MAANRLSIYIPVLSTGPGRLYASSVRSFSKSNTLYSVFNRVLVNRQFPVFFQNQESVRRTGYSFVKREKEKRKR